MDENNFRERAIELRGFIRGYVLGNEYTSAPHTAEMLKFLDDFLASGPVKIESTVALYPLLPETEEQQPTVEPEAAIEPKQRKGWSPEARAAQAERMRAMKAAKREAKSGEARAPLLGMAGGAS
jgi:hypothetical protein